LVVESDDDDDDDHDEYTGYTRTHTQYTLLKERAKRDTRVYM